MWPIHRIKHCAALKGKEILTIMNLGDIILTEISQPQKDERLMIPPRGGISSSQNPGDKGRMVVARGREEAGSGCSWSMGIGLQNEAVEVNSGDGYTLWMYSVSVHLKICKKDGKIRLYILYQNKKRIERKTKIAIMKKINKILTHY